MVGLAETLASAPPADLRGRLLAAVAERPRRHVIPMAPPEVYARRVDALDRLLGELTEADWSAPAAPYAWTVHELVAHLAVIEEYTARQLGLTGEAPLPAGTPSTLDHLAMGAGTVAELASGDPAATSERWRAAARSVVAHVTGASFDPAAPSPLHAWPFEATTALVVRAFELWTHGDDLRRATGRPLDVPDPAELRTMSSAAVQGLPVLLAVTDGRPMEPARVVLTGPGGGTFDLGPAGAGVHRRHLLVTDVVDFCRLVAQRLEPARLDHERDGDPEFLDALLRAAQAIAV